MGSKLRIFAEALAQVAFFGMAITIAYLAMIVTGPEINGDGEGVGEVEWLKVEKLKVGGEV